MWPLACEEKNREIYEALFHNEEKYTLPTATASLKPKVKADPTIIRVYKSVCNRVGRVN